MQKWLEEVQAILNQIPPDHQEGNHLSRRASVAVILRENSRQEPDFLFIERAERAEDPWSGQIAFPGGGVNVGESDLQAAIRETHEEVGISLQEQDHIGGFQDVQGRKGGKMLPFFISPHVFFYSGSETFALDSREVAEAMWIPLRHLMMPENFRHFEWQREEAHVKLPGIQFPNKILWGLTYMHLSNFFHWIKDTSFVVSLQKEIDSSREPFWFWEKYP